MATLSVTIHTPQGIFENLRINKEPCTIEECERAKHSYHQHGFTTLITYRVDSIGQMVEFSIPEKVLELSVIEWYIYED
jgi:hypothetical protein